MFNEEHEHMETLNQQLPVFRQIIRISNDFLTAFQNSPAYLYPQADFVSQAQDELNSVILNAEASITVIVGFLARSGQRFS